MKIRASGCSDPGSVRRSNEDVLLVDAELSLFAVLDGLGGAAAGELAARIAADALQLSLWQERFTPTMDAVGRPHGLVEAVRHANRAVWRQAASSDGTRGMGCTVTAVEIAGNRAAVAHVGDSRLYLVRDRLVHQITHDHTVAAELVRQGRMQLTESRNHRGAHTLTGSLGRGPEVEVETHELELRPADRLLLCTDGLSDYVENTEHLADLASADPIDITAANLLRFALDSGGHDNITILAIEMSAAAENQPHCGTSLNVVGLS